MLMVRSPGAKANSAMATFAPAGVLVAVGVGVLVAAAATVAVGVAVASPTTVMLPCILGWMLQW